MTDHRAGPKAGSAAKSGQSDRRLLHSSEVTLAQKRVEAWAENRAAVSQICVLSPGGANLPADRQFWNGGRNTEGS
jgi:hypothetical protein